MLRKSSIHLPRRFSRLTSTSIKSRNFARSGQGQALPLRWSSIVLLPMLLAVLAASVSATAARGRVEGNITDPSGAKIAGARVSLRDTSGFIAQRARSDDEGHFWINDVAVGHYNVI